MPPSSSVLSRWIPYSAAANAAIDSATPAAIGGTPSSEIPRTPSGYSGKNAVREAVREPRLGRYP